MNDSQRLYDLEIRLNKIEKSLNSKKTTASSLFDHEFFIRLRNIVGKQMLFVSEFTKELSNIFKVNSTQSDTDSKNKKHNCEIKID